MPSIDPLKRLRARIAACDGNQSRAAKELGVSPVYICDLLRGRRLFSDQMLARLGLQRRTIITTLTDSRSA